MRYVRYLETKSLQKHVSRPLAKSNPTAHSINTRFSPMTGKLTALLSTSWARTLKFIAFLAVFCGYAYFAYESLPVGFCGNCPKRSFSLLGPVRTIRITEWWHKPGEPDLNGQFREPTWLSLGNWKLRLSFSAQNLVLGILLASLLATRLCPQKYRLPRLLLLTAGICLFTALFWAFITRFVGGFASGFRYIGDEVTLAQFLSQLLLGGLFLLALCVLTTALWREFLRIKRHHETVWL